ncbi:nuclear transport factor 2 family protein [Moorella sulfitireducens (nom. illeg.)]|uniref:nuclear transport factor 2 family protein n=1 Tax=Neomoorella sulfitireducens TaxID=2972948 RepID=UPI0021ACE7D9|nr:nuclear transport factor 2 family protein [Moorella sulfitireducens]
MEKDLDRRLAYIEDMIAIQQLLNKYVYMLVTMDFEHIFEECFSQTRDDVSIQASDSGVYIGKEHVHERFFMKFMDFVKQTPGAFTMHLCSNPVIEISEDRKFAHSVAFSPGCATDPQNKEALWIWGTFIDDYIREDDGWKILHHAFVPLFRTPYDKGWTKQAVGTQLSKVSGKMADGPSQFWNPYDLSKRGEELWATLPKLKDLKKFD